MEDVDLKFFIEGHPGHRGNVLAHILHEKLGKLISALSQFDRKYADAKQRRTDYEIVDARKYNPTTLTLHPVAKVARYDVLPALNWAFTELEAVALGSDVDTRLDATLAQTLADLSEKGNELDYNRMWLERSGKVVDLNEVFRMNSLIIAARRREIEKPTAWRSGASYGSVVGYLSQVGDLDGETKLVILPKIGPDRVDCAIKDDDRETVKSYLWTTVRVHGLLHYTDKSPFPFRVDMERIEAVRPPISGKHLLDMRGIFKGKERSLMNLDSVING